MALFGQLKDSEGVASAVLAVVDMPSALDPVSKRQNLLPLVRDSSNGAVDPVFSADLLQAWVMEIFKSLEVIGPMVLWPCPFASSYYQRVRKFAERHQVRRIQLSVLFFSPVAYPSRYFSLV